MTRAHVLPARLSTGLLHGAVALTVCAALSLRSAAVWSVVMHLHPNAFLSTHNEQLAWIAAWYAMWAALTPLIFYLARTVRFQRGRWLVPLLFHLPASIIVTVSAGVTLGILFGALVLDRGWPEPRDLLSRFWSQMALVRALGDTAFYWIILAGGTLLTLYDDYQAKRLQAADLERSLVAAQVDALKMRLQPHFLFNTLNSIGFLALEKDTGAIVTMVERLGRLLRASIQSNGGQFVALEEELALLDQYLAIEEVRFKDRLRVVRRIDPGTRGALVPSLILQPIIENSIKHGFSRRLDASLLEITARREGDDLVIVVRDDGPGLPEGWDPATQCGRGLRNVLDRLDALYRGRWAFALRNVASGGSQAELRMPWSLSAASSAARLLEQD
jgi:two-component system, LytTR family, sensor kinase